MLYKIGINSCINFKKTKTAKFELQQDERVFVISSFSSLRGAGFSGSVGFSDVSDGAAFSGWVVG